MENRQKPTTISSIGNTKGNPTLPENGGYNTYVGARYVPVIYGEWNSKVSYEPLTIVSWQGNSYTSKTYVPANIDIGNTTYWVKTADYNAQVEYYRQDIERAKQDIDDSEARYKQDMQKQYDRFSASETAARNAYEGKIDKKQSDYEAKVTGEFDTFKDEQTQRQQDYEDTIDGKIVDETKKDADAWLQENITNPTDPPLDASLTLENAAANSKAVGDYALTYANRKLINDVNECDILELKQGYYIIFEKFELDNKTNSPFKDIINTNNQDVQTIYYFVNVYGTDYPIIYAQMIGYRSVSNNTKSGNSDLAAYYLKNYGYFNKWTYSNSVIMQKTKFETGDEKPIYGTYFYSSNSDNAPSNNLGGLLIGTTVCITDVTDEYALQTVYGTNGDIYSRYFEAGTWKDWKPVTYNSLTNNNQKNLIKNGDLFTLEQGIYNISDSGNITNSPFYKFVNREIFYTVLVLGRGEYNIIVALNANVVEPSSHTVRYGNLTAVHMTNYSYTETKWSYSGDAIAQLTDFNGGDTQISGTYFYSGSASENKPENKTELYVAKNTNIQDNYAVQEAVNGDGCIYNRFMKNGGWNDWNKFVPAKISSIDDINKIPGEGIYFISGTPLNNPFDYLECDSYKIVIQSTSTNGVSQLTAVLLETVKSGTHYYPYLNAFKVGNTWQFGDSTRTIMTGDSFLSEGTFQPGVSLVSSLAKDLFPLLQDGAMLEGVQIREKYGKIILTDYKGTLLFRIWHNGAYRDEVVLNTVYDQNNMFKVDVYGDSLYEREYSYMYQYLLKHRFTDYRNLSQPGAGYAREYTDGDIKKKTFYDTVVNYPPREGATYIVVAYGINDYNENITLENVITKFEEGINEIRKTNKFAMITVVTPLNTALKNANANTTKNTADVPYNLVELTSSIVNKAKELGCETVELNNAANIEMVNNTDYFYDKIHCTELGHRYVANYIDNKMPF